MQFSIESKKNEKFFYLKFFPGLMKKKNFLFLRVSNINCCLLDLTFKYFSFLNKKKREKFFFFIILINRKLKTNLIFYF